MAATTSRQAAGRARRRRPRPHPDRVEGIRSRIRVGGAGRGLRHGADATSSRAAATSTGTACRTWRWTRARTSPARVFSGLTGALLHTFTDLAADMCGPVQRSFPTSTATTSRTCSSARRGTHTSHYNGRLLLRSGRDGRLLRQLTHPSSTRGSASPSDPSRTAPAMRSPSCSWGARGQRVHKVLRCGARHRGRARARTAGDSWRGAAVPGGPPTLSLTADPLLCGGQQLRSGAPSPGPRPACSCSASALAAADGLERHAPVAPVVISAVTVPPVACPCRFLFFPTTRASAPSGVHAGDAAGHGRPRV